MSKMDKFGDWSLDRHKFVDNDGTLVLFTIAYFEFVQKKLTLVIYVKTFYQPLVQILVQFCYYVIHNITGFFNSTTDIL